MWARDAGTGFARRYWNTGTMESCGSLLASGRANFPDGVRRLARHVPAPATHISARPRSVFVPNRRLRNRLKWAFLARVSQQRGVVRTAEIPAHHLRLVVVQR
jgi:hypothetical protein